LSISARKGGIPGPPPGHGGGGEDGTYALSFDGNDGTYTPDSDALDLTHTFTIEGWIKPGNPNATTSDPTILSKWGGGGAASYGVAFDRLKPGGYLVMVTHNGTANSKIFGSTPLQADVWYHFAFVFDDGGQPDQGQTWLYINGALDVSCGGALGNCWDGSGPQNRPYMLTPMNSSSILTLGHYADTPPGGSAFNYYEGLLDEVRVWNVARAARDIAKNYRKTLNTRKADGIVAYWPMDEGTGSVAADASGNGHDQQLYNAPADPTWVPIVSRASVSVAPEETDLLVAASAQLTADVYDKDGNLLTDPVVAWSSSDETVATVDADGLVQGVAAGEATITAESEGASGTATTLVVAHCPFPLAFPNRWTESDGDRRFSATTDLYIPYGGSGTQCAAGTGPPGEGCDFTGYYPGSVNNPLEPLFEIKTQSLPPSRGEGPDYVASPCVDGVSWRCWYVPDGSSGASNLIDWVWGCPDESATVLVDDLLEPETGNVQSVITGAFKDLVDNNPAMWNDSHPTHPSGACATIDGGNGPCLGSEHPRIRLMPVVKTDQLGDNQSPAPVADRTCVFIDKVAIDFDQPHGGGPLGSWKLYFRFTDTCTGLPGWDGSF
jgi:hypothetical protein